MAELVPKMLAFVEALQGGEPAIGLAVEVGREVSVVGTREEQEIDFRALNALKCIHFSKEPLQL